MASGGYRKPGTPAPVSGPGALSQRTDGGPSQAPMYMPGMKSMGSTGREQMAQQQGAALYKAPTSGGGGISSIMENLPPVTPIDAPTEFPDQPIADGTQAFGGAGPEALMLPKQEDTDTDKQRLMSYLPALESAANMPNASVAFKNYVRLVRSLT
jgi:hypothetical protein